MHAICKRGLYKWNPSAINTAQVVEQPTFHKSNGLVSILYNVIIHNSEPVPSQFEWYYAVVRYIDCKTVSQNCRLCTHFASHMFSSWSPSSNCESCDLRLRIANADINQVITYYNDGEEIKSFHIKNSNSDTNFVDAITYIADLVIFYCRDICLESKFSYTNVLFDYDCYGDEVCTFCYSSITDYCPQCLHGSILLNASDEIQKICLLQSIIQPNDCCNVIKILFTRLCVGKYYMGDRDLAPNEYDSIISDSDNLPECKYGGCGGCADCLAC